MTARMGAWPFTQRPKLAVAPMVYTNLFCEVKLKHPQSINTNSIFGHLDSNSSSTHHESPTFSDSALEPHYSVQVLAELWRLDESTIRRMFEDVPGVLRIGTERRRGGKREYVTLRIPASIASREYQKRVVAETTKKRS
jgi:hypothetical protein